MGSRIRSPRRRPASSQLREAALRKEQPFTRRLRFSLLLVDEDGRVVLDEHDALRLLLQELVADATGPARLGSRLLTLVRERIASDSTAAIDLGHLMVYVHPMAGSLGTYAAIAVEPVRRREDLATQRERFGLTTREIDVLRLILQGQEASEIAVTLAITKNTATDYFKSLLRKTESRNRSEMLARLLGWQRR